MRKKQFTKKEQTNHLGKGEFIVPWISLNLFHPSVVFHKEIINLISKAVVHKCSSK